MALRITDDCIECLACVEVCPHQAITQVHDQGVNPRVAINPSACTHCWPFDQRPRCPAVCPVNCIVVDADQPVPSVQLMRCELEKVLSVAGPFEAARMLVSMRQWVREWFAEAVCEEPAAVDFDKILDFYSCLSLMEREYAPADATETTKTAWPVTTGSSV